MPFRGCHFGENLYKSFMNLGYEVENMYAQLLQDDITNEQYNRYLQRKELYPISKVLKRLEKKPQLVVVDQIGFGWKNDVNVPVFYKHNFFKRNPIVNYPTVALFPHEAVLEYFRDMFVPKWCDIIKELRVMPIAFDPDHFIISDEKSIKGISCIGGRENMKQIGKRRELTAVALVETSRQQVKKFIKLGLNWIDDGDGDGGGVTDARYREILPNLEALWVLIPFGQYISRRILEGMYCKCVCVIKIEDDYHEVLLEKRGFIAGEHYIKINKLRDMVELNKNWNVDDYKDMIEKAYQLVLENHIYDNRAKEIIEIYEEMKDKNETST